MQACAPQSEAHDGPQCTQPRASLGSKAAYNRIMTQVGSDLLAAYGHVEQAEHKKSNEVMADHVNLAICVAIGLS